MIRSRFVYDRSITDDLARVLAAARASITSGAQAITLDWVISEFANQAYEHDQSFDIERFMRTARFGYDLHLWGVDTGDDNVGSINEGGQRWQIQQ